jgi:hypothetical protein
MSEEAKQPEPTINQLFDAFCKQHGVAPVIVAESPVTKELVGAVNILVINWPLKILFVKPQG